MGALVAGIDLSSKRIDACLIPLDPSDGSDAPPVTLRSFEMPTWRRETTPAFRTVERCRVVRDAMRELLKHVGGYRPPEDEGDIWWIPEHEVVHVCVETPIGSKSRSTVLWELYGAILASIPSHIERDTIRTVDWRNLMLLPYIESAPDAPKEASIWLATRLTGVEMDEHQAEAFLIARACRARLEDAVKGAA